ncbi:MAG: amino acid ABC transporter permease [Clostridia bacterium]|nr:amino acid ABC transporter permease [Clostridia bacterium]
MFDDFFGKFSRAFLENNFSGLRLMADGLKNTILITLGALLLGVILGTILAVAKVLPTKNIFNKILAGIANVYIAVFRGTPVVVQLLLFYFGICAKIDIDPVLAAVICLGMNSGAYVAEIIRSGILAVDHGQMEAGRSLGLTYSTTLIRIVLPQAIKNILPALGNELIALIKETSVVSFITVVDITKVAGNIIAKTYEPFVPYLFLALIYLVIVLFATWLVGILERRMRQSDQR